MLYEKITYTLLAIKKLLFGKQKIDEKIDVECKFIKKI